MGELGKTGQNRYSRKFFSKKGHFDKIFGILPRPGPLATRPAKLILKWVSEFIETDESLLMIIHTTCPVYSMPWLIGNHS